MSDASSDTEPQRKGRSNAILTYEKVEEIVLGIQRVDLKVDELSKDIGEIGKQHTDHEVRIRALELTAAGSTGRRTAADWVFQAIWPLVTSILLGALAFFKQ